MNSKVFTKKNLKLLSNRYFNRQVNRIIIVLIILIGIYIIKLVNNTTTNKILVFIEKNIHHDFSLKEDGKKLKDTIVKIANASKGTIEELTGTMVK